MTDQFTQQTSHMKTLDIIECAEFLKIERTHALKLAGDGTLPGAKIGKAWVFLEEDLVEYLRAQVRTQQRQRAIDADVPEIPAPRKVIKQIERSPLAPRRTKRAIPNLDLYDSPEAIGQVTPSKIGVPGQHPG